MEKVRKEKEMEKRWEGKRKDFLKAATSNFFQSSKLQSKIADSTFYSRIICNR